MHYSDEDFNDTLHRQSNSRILRLTIHSHAFIHASKQQQANVMAHVSAQQIIQSGFEGIVRGWKGFALPILYAAVSTQYIISLFILSIFAVSYFFDSSFHPASLSAPLFCILTAFSSSAFMILHGCMQLALWKSQDKSASHRAWISDLPAVLGLNACKFIINTLGNIAIASGIFVLIFRVSFAAILLILIGMVIHFASSILCPSILAERLVHGPGFLRSISSGVSSILKHPLRTLCLRYIPMLMRFFSFGLFILGFHLQYFNLMITGVLLLFLASAGEPAFWLSSARYSEN